MTGRVATVDHFGNVITTIRASDLEGQRIGAVSWSGGTSAVTVATYDGIPAGTLGALVGSAGHVEIAARGVPAASLGGPAAHAEVAVAFA